MNKLKNIAKQTIVKELKQKYKAERIHRELSNISFTEILDLVKRNEFNKKELLIERIEYLTQRIEEHLEYLEIKEE